jgi:DNA-binding CsgD family transcriptional regulator
MFGNFKLGKEFYEKIANLTPAGISIWDVNELEIKWVNLPGLQFFGYGSPADSKLLGRSFFAKNFHSDDLYLIEDGLAFFEKNPSGVFEAICRIKGKNHSWFKIWTRSRVLAFKNEKPHNIISYLLPLEQIKFKNEILGRKIKPENEIKLGYFERVTTRELEIIQLIAHGHTNKEIASTLFLSPDTIKTHRKNILNKLSLRNTAELVKYAVKLQLA